MIYSGENRLVPASLTGLAANANVLSCTLSIYLQGSGYIVTGLSTAFVQNETAVTSSYLVNTTTYAVGSYLFTFSFTLDNGETIDDFTWVLIESPIPTSVASLNSITNYFLTGYYLLGGILNNFTRSIPYFPIGYFPSSVNLITQQPTVVLYPPYKAIFLNGESGLTVSLSDQYVVVDAVVIDTPPSHCSKIDLTSATVKFSLRNIISSSNVISGNTGIVVAPNSYATSGVPGTSIKLTNAAALNECMYVLSPADIALLIPGKYIGSFLVTFANGSIIEFSGLQIYVVAANN